MSDPAGPGPDDGAPLPAGGTVPGFRGNGRLPAMATAILVVVIAFFIVTGLHTVKSTDYSKASAAIYDTTVGLSLAKFAWLVPEKASSGKSKAPRHADEAISYFKHAAEEDPLPTSIRRYGIALLLFNKPGGRQVLSTVASHLPAPGKPGYRPGAVADEDLLWEQVYGQAPILKSQVPEILARIRRRQLGWLGLSAEATLYRRAGLSADAQRVEALMKRNGRELVRLALLRGLLYALGITAWMVLGLNRILTRAGERFSSPASWPGAAGPATVSPAGAAGSSNGMSPGALEDQEERSFPDASSPARGRPPAVWYVPLATAFALYLLLPEFLRPLEMVIPTLSHPTASSLSLLFYIQVAIYLPVVGAPVWLLQRLTRAPWRVLRERLGVRTSSVLADIGYGILGYILIFPLQEIATSFSEFVFRRYRTPVNPVEIEMAHAHSSVQIGLLFVLAVLVGPLTEELMFRGVLLQALRARWRDVTAVLISSAIFASIHPTLPAGFLTIWILGIAFSMMALRRRSLLPSFCTHALYNAFILMTMLLTSSG